MGTRSLTFVYDGERPIINLYRQYDGYPSGHGRELAEFLEGYTIVNGLGEKRSKLANGMGCLAAQMVAHFKTEVGQFYLHSPEQKDCGQDFEYHVYSKDNELRVAITNRGDNFYGLTTSDVNESIFDGPVADFVRFCSEEELA